MSINTNHKKPQVLACGFFVRNHCIFPYGYPCNSHAILALVLTCTYYPLLLGYIMPKFIRLK
ncbi:hypothetical protein CPI03_05725 [Moraxella catarrhalis]|nr:hypothetical protein MC195_08025 [Moraxella catarrhalis]MPW65573.1 hypothetical protein [Moraxella catarrhalis]MPW76335.1 hypothetical protein [Moraxella catarrhalis]MPX01095.1 hypothetical protein [Moraxella catarrhalis]OBX40741.1 hypothetical protein A9Z59_02620 [Moraxella catarrhalis]